MQAKRPKPPNASLFIALLVFIVTMVALLFLSASLPAVEPASPDWLRVEDFGCSIDQQGAYRRAIFWIMYKQPDAARQEKLRQRLKTCQEMHGANIDLVYQCWAMSRLYHDWEWLYSMREKLKDALNDCETWVAETEKRIEKAKKEDGQK